MMPAAPGSQSIMLYQLMLAHVMLGLPIVCDVNGVYVKMIQGDYVSIGDPRGEKYEGA